VHGFITPSPNIDLKRHRLSLLVNENAAECNVSKEKIKLSRNYPRWRYRPKRNCLL